MVHSVLKTLKWECDDEEALKQPSVQPTDIDEVQVLELGDGRHLEGGLLDRLCEVRDQVLEVNRLDGVHQQDW